MVRIECINALRVLEADMPSESLICYDIAYLTLSTNTSILQNADIYEMGDRLGLQHLRLTVEHNLVSICGGSNTQQIAY